MIEKFQREIGVTIILLGLVSFLADTSSEIVTPILPMFISALGGAGVVIGVIGGLSDSIASMLKVFAGYWSDRIGKRKPFVSSGYITSAVSKLFLPFSTTWQHVLFLKPFERVGKGLRDAPRDAMIADSAAIDRRGKAFGIHRAMDTAGAIMGSALAFVLFWLLGLEFRSILLISAIVAFLALIPLYYLKEEKKKTQTPTSKIGLSKLPRNLRFFITIATIFALGNFTYMFFIIRAQGFFAQILTEKMAVAIPILLYVLYNIIYTLFSIPIGILSDKIGRGNILFFGYLLFGLTCLGFAFVDSSIFFIIFFGLYGLVNAFVDGTQRALASDLASVELRGTALGAFHTSVGLAALPASIIAGILWQEINPTTTFIYGSITGFFASTVLWIFIRGQKSRKPPNSNQR